VYLVLLAAAAAILTGVVAVAMGWGGQQAVWSRDLPAFPLLPSTAYEIAALRLPENLFGYQVEATDEVLAAIAGLVADRDAEIARLRDELHAARSRTGLADEVMSRQGPLAGQPLPPS
jgi:hypothetical protein